MVELKGCQKRLHSLIDISQIPELKSISKKQIKIHIGASITHQQIIDAPLLNTEIS